MLAVESCEYGGVWNSVNTSWTASALCSVVLKLIPLPAKTIPFQPLGLCGWPALLNIPSASGMMRERSGNISSLRDRMSPPSRDSEFEPVLPLVLIISVHQGAAVATQKKMKSFLILSVNLGNGRSNKGRRRQSRPVITNFWLGVCKYIYIYISMSDWEWETDKW